MRGAARDMRDRPDLRAVKASVVLHELVGRHVTLKRRDRTWWGLCPFHGEKTPSFTVDDVKGRYHCFGCGAHGSAIDFVMEMESCGLPEAVRRLTGELPDGVPRVTVEEALRRERALAAREAAERAQRRDDAAAIWRSAVPIRPGDLADRYLRGRGLAQVGTAEEPWPASLRLGWCVSKAGRRWPALVAGVTRWPDRHVVAVQQTPLEEPGVKAWSDPSRVTRGDYRTGAVRLSCWAEGAAVHACEGVEDGLAVLADVPGVTVWSILGTDNAAAVHLPDGADLIFVLDGDRAGRLAVAKADPVQVGRGHRVLVTELPAGLDPLERHLAARPDFELTAA